MQNRPECARQMLKTSKSRLVVNGPLILAVRLQAPRAARVATSRMIALCCACVLCVPVPVAADTLIGSPAAVTAMVPTDGSLGDAWKQVSFDDSGWVAGQTAVGYENGSGYESLLGIEFRDEMFNVATTAYIRIPFTVNDPGPFLFMTLRMQYDDGFAAFLNGTLVASANAPVTLAWDSSATQQNPDDAAVAFEDFDTSAYISLLRPGANVLAIHGLNENPGSSDMLIQAELIASSTEADPILDTSFSHDRGFYDAPFDVAVTTDAPNATIRYTTDGTAPSQTHGIVYTDPIHVSTTTTLRACAYADGYQPSNVDTQTYIFLPDVLTQPAAAPTPQFPSQNVNTGSSQSVPIDYEMDPDVVDDPATSGAMMNAMTSIPTVSIVGDAAGIFDAWINGGGSASDIEYPVSAEWLYFNDPTANTQVDAGLRPHSHQYLKRSLRLVFRSEYGDAKFKHDLFAESPLAAESATDEFDRLVLRAGGNRNFTNYWNPDDSTYTRDEWARATQMEMSGVASQGAFAHLYVNGVYMGLYNPVERPDHFFQAAYYGGDQDDYFAVNHGGAISGDATRWNYLKGTLKNKDMSVQANYEQLKQYLDVEPFADYLILNLSAGTDDWPNNNWYAGMYTGDVSGGAPGPMRFFVWDAEDIWDDEGSSGPFDQAGGRGSDGAWITPELVSTKGPSSGPDIANIFHAARASEEFMLTFADRAYKHLSHDGALTDAANQQRWTALNEYVRDAVIAESARWGDARDTLSGESGVIRTRDGVWQAEADRVLTQSMPGNAQRTINVLRAEGYYPSINPPIPSIHGGAVAAGSTVTISNPNGSGTIYYTADESDPRLVGGAVSPTAHAYTGPISINANTRLRMRILDGGQWSAQDEVDFTLDTAPLLRITEIMYNPPAPSDSEIAAGLVDKDQFEFIEVRNVGSTSLNLGGYGFAEGITFAFPFVVLPAGDYAVIVADQGAFNARYGTVPNVLGAYTGQLNNGGERLRLTATLDQTILDFAYDDAWKPITDGDGFSLVIIDPAATVATWADADAWRPSALVGGSPGTGDAGVAPDAIVISEILTHTDGPDGDWIELHNTTDGAIDIGGWFLSDDGGDLAKYEIASDTVVPAGGFAVFTQDEHFGVGSGDPGSHVGFGLTELGETVHLSSGADGQLTGYRTSESFAAADKETTFGRVTLSTGAADFATLTWPTPGAANATALVGPVVINEIMFNPAVGDDEFIELHNLTGTDAPLYDPQNPANPWRFTEGVDYAFAAGDVVPANGYALVVGIEPGVFASRHDVPAGVPIYGPYLGVLDNGGERLTLSRPGEPEPTPPYVTPMITADHVRYDDLEPWYARADGEGSSVSKLPGGDRHGNDPANWAPSSSGGTPGEANVTLDATPPTTPTAVAAIVAGYGRIDLSWAASADPETSVALYHVHRNGVEIGTTGTASFIDATAVATVSYAYEISAENIDGAESPRSSAAEARIMAVDASAVLDATHVRITFSESVDPAVAADVEGYVLGGGDVGSAIVEAGGRSVLLTTSTLTEGQTYALAIFGVVGLSGGQLPPGAVTTFTRSSRVDEGLVVLYDMEEGAGGVVHDVSGVGLAVDLTIANASAVTWVDGGLSINAATIIASAGPASKISNAVIASEAITIEAWVLPTTVDQSGPARIVTLSADTSRRNFTLGQEFDAYQARLRTTVTGDNGTNPVLAGSSVLQTSDLAHVVYTRAANGVATMYVDSAVVGGATISGDLSNWNTSYSFALANELTMDRSWRGQMHLVAVYDRALDASEVEQNYLAGANPAPPIPVSSVVLARNVFYNNSSMDGNTPAADVEDDSALAPTKIPLTGGQAVTAANSTSYARGLNGVMIDIAGLAGTPTTDDFTFALADAPVESTWTAAPAPQSITVRPGAGVGGSDRVTLIWPDGAISNMWLEVTVKATPPTALAADDVFAFGNCPGDSDGDGDVDLDDFVILKTNFGAVGVSVDQGDFDGSGEVDLSDFVILKNNFSSP